MSFVQYRSEKTLSDFRLVLQLLSTLVDVNGNVKIPGFYDNVRPLTKEEEEMYRRIEVDLDAYREVLREALSLDLLNPILEIWSQVSPSSD